MWHCSHCPFFERWRSAAKKMKSHPLSRAIFRLTDWRAQSMIQGWSEFLLELLWKSEAIACFAWLIKNIWISSEKCRFMDKRLREISRFLLRRRACFPSPSARAPASQRKFLSKNTCSSVVLCDVWLTLTPQRAGPHDQKCKETVRNKWNKPSSISSFWRFSLVGVQGNESRLKTCRN